MAARALLLGNDQRPGGATAGAFDVDELVGLAGQTPAGTFSLEAG